MVNLKRLAAFDDRMRRDNLPAFIMSQVTSSEQSRSTNSSIDPEAMADVARAAGYVDVCAAKNAEKLAANPISLYRPARRGRSVRGRQGDYLRGKTATARTKFNEQVNADDDGYELVENHPALDVLRNPNPYLSNGVSLRFVLAYGREITGNSYAAYFPDDGVMYPMAPGYTKIIPNEDDGKLIADYVYGRDASAVMRLSPKMVHHQILRYDLTDPYKGRSWLAAIRDTADLWNRVGAYMSQLMLNHGRPDVLIHFDGHQTPEQWEQTQQSIFGRMRKAISRATGILMTNSREGSVSVNQLGLAPKDVEVVQILNEAEQIIWNAAGIPETVMRMADANRASADAGEYAWCKNTIMPRAIQEADEWTAWLHEWFPDTEAAGMFFAPDDCVPEDVERKERIAVQGWQSGILTRNESRALFGYEPVESGNEFFKPQAGQVVPQSDPLAEFFGLSANAEPKLVVSRRKKEHAPGDESDHDKPKPVEEPDKPKAIVETDPKAYHYWNPSGSHDAPEWSQAKDYAESIDFAKTPESLTGEGERETRSLVGLFKAFERELLAQMDDVLKAMDGAPMGLKGAHPRRYAKTQFGNFFEAWGLTNIRGWAERMQSSTEDIVRQEFARRAVDSLNLIANDAPEAIAERIPDPVDDDLGWLIEDNRAAQITRRYADRYAATMEGISQTTATMLARTLSRGLEEGEGLNQLQDRVRAAFLNGDKQTIAQSRAARIARTEIAQAQSEGRIAGMAGSRVVRGYEFVMAVGACPICQAVRNQMEGKVFGIDEHMFKKGDQITATDGRIYKFDYQDTIVPIHPNCRCEVRPVLVEL